MRSWLLAKLSALLALGVGTWLNLAYAGLLKPSGDSPVDRFSVEVSQLGMPVAQLPPPVGPDLATGADHVRRLQADVFSPRSSAGAGIARPVLIYLPGWPGTLSDNARLLADLASHGYLVVQLRILHEDPRLTGGLDFSTDAIARATLWKAETKIGLQARDASALLDTLHRLATGTDTRFGQLDLDQVGVLGFSFGGAIATQCAWADRRFRAALNMDGWLFGEARELDFPQPYLVMSDDEADPTPAELASPDPATRLSAQLTEHDLRRIRRRLQHPGALMMVIRGSGHESFSNTPLHFSLRGRSLPRPVQALRISIMIRRYATAFFDKELKGASPPLLSSATSPYPEVALTQAP